MKQKRFDNNHGDIKKRPIPFCIPQLVDSLTTMILFSFRNSKSEVDYFETNRFWSCILHFTELKNRLPEGLHIQRTNDGFIITSSETPTIAIAVPVYNMEETMNVTKLPDSAQLVFKTRLQPNNKPDSRCSIMNGTIFCYCNLCVAEMQQQNTSKQLANFQLY